MAFSFWRGGNCFAGGEEQGRLWKRVAEWHHTKTDRRNHLDNRPLAIIHHPDDSLLCARVCVCLSVAITTATTKGAGMKDGSESPREKGKKKKRRRRLERRDPITQTRHVFLQLPKPLSLGLGMRSTSNYPSLNGRMGFSSRGPVGGT